MHGAVVGASFGAWLGAVRGALLGELHGTLEAREVKVLSKLSELEAYTARLALCIDDLRLLRRKHQAVEVPLFGAEPPVHRERAGDIAVVVVLQRATGINQQQITVRQGGCVGGVAWGAFDVPELGLWRAISADAPLAQALQARGPDSAVEFRGKQWNISSVE